jgi:hypothetical protein
MKDLHKNPSKKSVVNYNKTRNGTPVDHPQNCEHECPYGFDRPLCFPCYKKILKEMREKRKEKNGI